MVVIVNEKSKLSNEDGEKKKAYRSRHSKGWSKRRGAEVGTSQDTYHGKMLLQSTSVKRFQPSFPHTHVRVIVDNDICSVSEARMAWGQTVMLYKVINACPSNRVRAILDLNLPARTSMHPCPASTQTMLTSFRGFLSLSAGSVAPVSLPAQSDHKSQITGQTRARSPSQPDRNRLYMRMTLAERDSLLKHHVARLPIYAYHLLGAYQDPHQNTVIVLADMQRSCLANSMNKFKGSEDLVIGSAVLPLLQQLLVLHSHHIAHHHLSPWHVFIPSEQARSLTCTLPCPAAHPADINKLLATAVPAEYFAPEVWSFNDGSSQTGSGVACLNCDMWSLGVICTCLFLGRTIFKPSSYTNLFRDIHHREHSNMASPQASAGQNSEGRSLLSRAAQVISAVKPTFGNLVASLSSRAIGTSCQASVSDVTRDLGVPEWEDCLLEEAVKDQVEQLVEQQLVILRQAGASPDLLLLIRGLLEPDPNHRLTPSDALVSPVFRRFIRTDAADQSKGSPNSPRLSDSASPAPGLQLWGVVRQSRPQLAEMARRETLVATLADRRDALDRLADLVNTTLAGESSLGDMANAPAGVAGKVLEEDASESGGSAMNGKTSQHVKSTQLTQTPSTRQPARPLPVTILAHSTSENCHIAHRLQRLDTASMPTYKLSGRVRFSGVGEASSTMDSNSTMVGGMI